MRTMILITAGLLALATAYSLTFTGTFTGTPTPKPTYTPYPTYTPAPLIPLAKTSVIPTPAIQTRIGNAYSSLEQDDTDITSETTPLTGSTKPFPTATTNTAKKPSATPRQPWR